eukprot:jgi/Botrbrau1/14045/Bobra.0011s0011.1
MKLRRGQSKPLWPRWLRTHRKDKRSTATPAASSQLPSFSAANIKGGHSKFFGNLLKTAPTQASQQADSEEPSETTEDGAMEEEDEEHVEEVVVHMPVRTSPRNKGRVPVHNL